MKSRTSILSVLCLVSVFSFVAFLAFFQDSAFITSKTSESANCFMVPFKAKIPASPLSATHHMADIDVVDDAPPHIQHYRSEIANMCYAFSPAQTPFSFHISHILTPAYEVMGPPPKG